MIFVKDGKTATWTVGAIDGPTVTSLTFRIVRIRTGTRTITKVGINVALSKAKKTGIDMESGKDLIHSFNNGTDGEENFNGLNKLEYFSGQALQGLLANPNYMKIHLNRHYLIENEIVARVAVKYANALLEELEKQH